MTGATACVSEVGRFSNPLAACCAVSFSSQSGRKLPLDYSSGVSFGHSSQRLFFFVCCGLPHYGGSLGERRHERQLLVFLVLRRRQSQRGQPELQFDRRQPIEWKQPCERFLRALRPASASGCFRLTIGIFREQLPTARNDGTLRLPPARPIDSAIR